MSSPDYWKGLSLGLKLGKEAGYKNGYKEGSQDGYGKALADVRAVAAGEDAARFQEGKLEAFQEMRDHLAVLIAHADPDADEVPGCTCMACEEDDLASPGCSVPVPCPHWESFTLYGEPVISNEEWERIREASSRVTSDFLKKFNLNP